MGDLIILASYPKTGSTWLRLLLARMLAPEEAMVRDAIPSLLKHFPANSPRFALKQSDCRILKTHLHRGDHRIREIAGQVKGIITIQRHPLDVMLSTLNYAFLKQHAPSFIGGLPKSVDDVIAAGEMDHYVNVFLENDGMPWHNAQSGSYSSFIRSWREVGQETPYHEVCYERMVEDTEAAAHDLLEFLGVGLSERTVRNAVRAVDQETVLDGQFYWRRRAYNFRTLLHPDLILRFETHYADVLRDNGYATAAANAAKHRQDARETTATKLRTWGPRISTGLLLYMLDFVDLLPSLSGAV